MNETLPDKKSSICTYSESNIFLTSDIFFLLPGLILWIIGACWCFRKNNTSGAMALQIIGALELAIGGIALFILAITNLATNAQSSGGFDPLWIFYDIEHYGSIALTALISHVVLLLISLTLFIHARKKTRS